jgi:hypothetical protein
MIVLAVERGSLAMERGTIAGYVNEPMRLPKASGSGRPGSPITGV